MVSAQGKRAHTEKKIKTKYEALLALENGTPHKEVAERFGIPKNTLSTWKQNKTKIMEAYRTGYGAKGVKPETYEVSNNALVSHDA